MYSHVSCTHIHTVIVATGGVYSLLYIHRWLAGLVGPGMAWVAALMLIVVVVVVSGRSARGVRGYVVLLCVAGKLEAL